MSDTRHSDKDYKALTRTKEEWERAFASLPDMVAILDNQYRILRVNEAMARRIGAREEECIGMLCYEAVHGLSGPPEFCPHSRALKDGRPHSAEVHEERWGGDFIFHVTPMTDEQGAMVGAVYVAHDVTERKQAERKLQESEAMLARAQQMAHVGHWYREISTGKGHWSDETYRIFGLKPQEREVPRRFLLERIHPDDRARVDRALTDAAEDVRPYNEIYRVVRPDSSTRWVHARGEVSRAPDGKPTWIFGTILDITERKQMEDALREARDKLEVRVRERTAEIVKTLESLEAEVEVRKHSEKLMSEARDLAAALSATSDLQVALDLCLDSALRIGAMDFGGVYLVDPYSGHLRLAAHRKVPEALLREVSDYGPDTPNARLVSACDPVYGPWKNLNLHPDGAAEIRGIAILPICHEGIPVACLNLASIRADDIPASAKVALETVAAQVGAALVRIQAEAESKRLATVVEQAGEAIIMVDQTFRIQYINPVVARMTGYGQEELIGEDVACLRPDKGDPGVYEAAREQMRVKGVWLGRLTQKKKDGTLFSVESFSSSIRDRDGNITGYTLLWRDITDQVRLEEQLRQSQKMEAIGTLAGGVAHDFNNILAIILGNAELAQEEDDRDTVGHCLDQIVGASKRGKELVRQILTFSRKTEQKRANLHLIPLVQEISDMLRASTPSNISMNLRMETGADVVFADPAEIQQILMNLITNAAQAMRAKGGRLTISLSDVTFAPDDPLPEPDMRPGDYLKLTVTDTGTGMTAEVRQRIFDPFFTTKEVGQGTGMGLAVAYAIVRSYHGAIAVESRRAKGSVFTVLLPKPEVVNVALSETNPAAKAPRGTERILFVDDEEPIVLVTRSMLERLGYEVAVATDPAEAWRLFREGPFDLVIADQTMPGTTGLALAQRMLKMRKNTPIILCTGYSEAVSPEKAKSAGVREFIMKPVHTRELAKAVRRVLDSAKQP